MKKRYLILLLLLLIIPIKCLAISESYVDVVSNYAQVEKDDNKINLYLFHGQECPHCEEERQWLETIKEKYNDKVNFQYFEVWHNLDNASIMERTKIKLGINYNGVPLTIIGDQYFQGFTSASKSRIENKIKEYIKEDNQEENSDNIEIPILGNVNIKNVSIPLVAIILGFIDGFNPCAMWILLFLISLLFGMNNKKKAWILGLTFLFISGFVYFLSMLGINIILGIATINWMKIAIAIFILIAGLLNFKKYLKIRKEEAGCTVVDDKKRKSLITKMRKIIDSKSFILALGGIIILATTVNLIEMACSLGFPLIFNEVLTVNEINGITKILYLLIYIFFYMIDDMVVFAISMFTLEATGITNKYNKLCTLISSIIMIIMGLLLLFKPEWIMFNF